MDFICYNGGSIYLLSPQTDAAREWCKEFLPSDAPRLGQNYAVEHRFISDIVNGIENDGLTVEGRMHQ